MRSPVIRSLISCGQFLRGSASPGRKAPVCQRYGSCCRFHADVPIDEWMYCISHRSSQRVRFIGVSRRRKKRSKLWEERGPDGTGARLPFRWPGLETGKTFLSALPSRPVDTVITFPELTARLEDGSELSLASSQLFGLAKRDKLATIFVPKDEVNAAKTFHDGDAADIAELRIVFQHFRKPVTGNP